MMLLQTATWPLLLVWKKEKECHQDSVQLVMWHCRCLGMSAVKGWSWVVILCISKVGWDECGMGHWLWHPKIYNDDLLVIVCRLVATSHLDSILVHVSSSVHPCVVIHSCVVTIHQLLVAMLPTAAWPLHLMWERRGGEESCYSPEYCGQWRGTHATSSPLFIHWVGEVVLPRWSIIILCFSEVGWEECGMGVLTMES